jgi:hypothetical protein
MLSELNEHFIESKAESTIEISKIPEKYILCEGKFKLLLLFFVGEESEETAESAESGEIAGRVYIGLLGETAVSAEAGTAANVEVSCG